MFIYYFKKCNEIKCLITGIKKLLADGIYSAAYPLHEVCMHNLYIYFFNFKRLDCIIECIKFLG